MRDEGGLVTSRSALRYLMTTIGRALSPEKDPASPVSSSESRLCASVNSLRIIDPSMPSTGLIISRCVTAVRHNASPDILSPDRVPPGLHAPGENTPRVGQNATRFATIHQFQTVFLKRTYDLTKFVIQLSVSLVLLNWFSALTAQCCQAVVPVLRPTSFLWSTYLKIMIGIRKLFWRNAALHFIGFLGSTL